MVCIAKPYQKASIRIKLVPSVSHIPPEHFNL